MKEKEILKKVEDYVKEKFPEYWELHMKDPEKYPIYPELLKSLKHRYRRSDENENRK